MALSYDELRLELVWRQQYTPPALEWLAEQLRAEYGQTANDIGSPGDNRHVSGGHRSRAWLLSSEYAQNPSYTTTHPDDKLGDSRWYCAIDIGGMSQAKLIAMCRRLDAAVRAGELEECWEWYGNLGGDDRVDGWNNLENRLASSDSSHLYHLHMTFRRRYANDMGVMRRALAILIGDDMQLSDKLKSGVTVEGAFQAILDRTNYLANVLKLDARLAALQAAAEDDGDVTVVLAPEALAEVKAIRADLAAVPAATAQLVHDDLAD